MVILCWIYLWQWWSQPDDHDDNENDKDGSNDHEDDDDEDEDDDNVNDKDEDGDEDNVNDEDEDGDEDEEPTATRAGSSSVLHETFMMPLWAAGRLSKYHDVDAEFDDDDESLTAKIFSFQWDFVSVSSKQKKYRANSFFAIVCHFKQTEIKWLGSKTFRIKTWSWIKTGRLDNLVHHVWKPAIIETEARS